MRNLTVLLIILLIVGCGTVETKTLKNEGNQKPKLLINASAIGIYSNDGILNEYSNNFSKNFISVI